MKSLLYQDGGSPFTEPTECGALPCRTEVPITIAKYGKLYQFVLRDKIVPEDPYLILVKAAGYALALGEAYNGTPPERSVKDFLIKSSVVI